MLSSPQSLTINSVATALHKITEDKTSSLYAAADGTLELKVSHQENRKRIRRMVRVDQTVIAADPLTAESAYQKAGVYVVIDEPNFGFSDTDLTHLVEALKTYLTTATITAVLSSRH